MDCCQTIGNKFVVKRFQTPDSRLLKILLFFLMGGLCAKLGLLFQKRDTLSDHVGNFFLELIFPCIYGAFGSEFSLVWLGAATASVAFGFAVCGTGNRAAFIAKGTLLVLLILSLFTIWVEPFISVSAAVGSVLMTLAKIPMTFVSIGVSVMWLLVFRQASIEIDNKLATCDKPTPQNRESSESTRSTTTSLMEQGKIILVRPWSMNQSLYGVTVLVDQMRIGKLRNGETLTHPVSAGKHAVTVKFFVFTTTIEVFVNPREDSRIEQTFGTWIASPKLKLEQ